MYRKRAQEERENVARWTPVAEPPRVQAPPVVVQTHVPEPVVVAPRIDVDWAAEVANAGRRGLRGGVSEVWPRLTVI